MALMISVSGIRGVFGRDLTPENLVRFTSAYGTWLEGGTVVVGRDTRVSGALCQELVSAALRSVGCEVIRVGVAPTPTVAMAVLNHGADGGIVISASHNPAEWNALKLLNERSEFLDAAQGERVIEISESGEIAYRGYDRLGGVSDDEGALEHHIERILALPYIDPRRIADAGFSVGIDPVNGTGAAALPPLLEKLGVERTEMINGSPDGRFARIAEPLAEHLEDLGAMVREKGLDLGIAVDPDSDRLALVSERGEPFGEEYTQAAAFDFLLEKNPGPCATNLSSSRVVDDVADRHGQACHRSAVGEINVVRKMQEVSAVIGGEGNGGVIAPDLHYGRDALAGTAMVLQLLAEREIPASRYRASLPDYHMRKDKIPLEEVDGDALLRRAEEAFAGEEIDTTDGVKIDFEEGWVHLRKSNTEPILRVYSEGKSPESARGLAARVTETIT